MSESIVRKVQPFTIGTRLSVPVVPKCPDFTQSYLQSSSSSSSLDNCVALQCNVNDSVSLYLSRSQVCARGPRLVPSLVNHPLPVPVKQRPEDMAAEDHANQNTVSSAAASRSIKKITISGNVESADSVAVARPHKLPVKTFPSENNNNNNNITTTSKPQLPRIVGVSCENKPSAQFKVLLRKDSIDCGSIQGQTRLQLNRGKSIQQISVPRPRSPKRELQNKAVWPHIDGAAAATSHTDCFAQRTSLFTTEILQAEAWIKRKQQDLKDSCNIQCCPLQDRKEALQTLQRDLRDFENTLIQLNQMGEQLICKLNPLSDLVKKQFSQLRDQWQALKQTAANQSRVMGGAKYLQEFNKKVDKLEAWIKDKEEGEQTLAGVLRENLDKMQLTRRILDLKQDEQLHRNLLEEINHLALSLEKQGKADGRNISSRRKHINKMWLRVQAHLKNYHENLHLALEASSFYQQADNTLFAINNMRKSMSACKDPETYGDREIRDIASQIMMLDVTVSQLSNLHPALADGVTQKQSELKDCWALLQKAFSSDRAALPSYGSTFTREDVDPLTPAREPQCSVGMEPLRTMGKEVKEEHNRLKGYVNVREETSARRPPGSRSPEQQIASHNPSPQSIDPTRTHDVMLRHQSEPDSRKAQAEPRLAVATRGHTQLHVQLQKFTVSADKTLSWLKNSVAMATQVCSLASCEGPEAAKRCQDVLEQEILSNGARIEVVKKEGRELVRAQHPGSAKIQVFLSQLEVLWEELRRRHQRNSVFLQASEELGFRVVKVLQALGSLEAWLESVELSMRESSLAGDPETMSVAERESCLLEREVAARSLELSALRQEVDRLGGQCLPHAQALPERMEEVEKKYHRVQSALTQQSSELQDTRMLTEFLERVELEETQDFSSSHYSLGQPLHSDISSAAAALGLQSAGDSESLLESMGDPVEELREAVEMLNDTVRERGRSQSHDQAVQQLLSKHASVAVRVEDCLRCSKELCMDLLERETDMAVKCEPDRCGLMGLQDTQEQLEIEHGTIALEVEEMKSQASRLEELCPERVHVLASKIQATLEAWTELRKSVTANRRRMEEFVQLQGFFRSYLAMISWTEDTRSCIFSDTALHLGTDGTLDRQIERKFEEFDELASTGRNLLDAEHHLTEMVKERMEELRSMLGWISVHWRAQKQQWLLKTKTQDACQDNIYTEATLGSPFSEASAPEQDTYMFCQSSEGHTCTVDSPASATPTGQGGSLSEDGYEVMKSVAPRGGEAFSTESSKSSVVVLKEAGPPSLGATVNLILSFGGSVDSEVQILELPSGTEEEEMSELVHRVSTYLHMKDNNLALTPVYESITLPRPKTHPSASAASSARPRSTSPSPSPVQPLQTASVSLHPAARGGSGSIFSSLKRMGKKRKRKRDARRHTIQKVMGVEGRKDGEPRCCVYEPIAYDTRTWPLKEGRRQKGSPHSPAGSGGESAAYVKNPLLKDIESECSGEYVITPYAMSEGPSALPSASHTRSHCRFLSLGSVISFDLPTDMSLIPSIQDVITIAHPESKKAGGTGPDANSHRHTALSSFKQTAAFSPSPAAISSSCNLPQGQTQGQTQGQNQGQTQGQTQGQNHGQTEGQIRVSLVKDLADVDEETQPPPAIGLGEDEKQVVPCDVLSDSHKCLGVHTLTQGLRTHPYHKSANPRYATEEGPAVSQACHMVVSLKRRQDSMDSGVSSCGSFKVCSDNLQPRGVVGRLLSLDVGAIGCSKPGVSSLAAASAGGEARPVSVDRQQFEEEEEELEDIWSRSSSSSYRRSVCSDIMYQPHREEAGPDSSPPPGSAASRSPVPKAPAVLYRKLATASAPDLLVAELRLPSSVQTPLGYGRGRGSVDQLPLVAKAGHSRSWAVLPDREVACEPSPTANETASAQVTLRHIEDSGRYIYQYREVEEHQEKEEEEVVGVEECTGCWKDPSISVDVDGVGQQRTGSSDCLEDKHEEQMATRGRSNTMSGVPELQSMEGTLERKHKLQFGGKRAPCRGWNSYHAVLHRNTLCFYQDTKDALRSSVCGLPLNLTGAECSPAPEYTKKPNCFCLRLRDGSEYLFNASSRFMMKKWMLKIQACTGPSGSVPLCLSVPVKPGLPAALSSCSACHGLSQCLCPSRHDAISTFPRRKATGTVQAKEIVVLTREYSHTTQSCLKRPQEQFTVAPSSAGLCDKGLCQGDDLGGVRRTSPLCSDEDCLSNKQRSHSFTSATYQKIRPPFQTAAVGGGSSSNYSVTLVIGDKASGSPSVSRGPEAPQLGVAGAWPDPALRSYASLPRPHNKSVFKKFFGKRDEHV